MAKLTAQELVAKHNRNTKAAISDYQRGVERVREAPGVKAAAKQDKMRMNLIQSIDDGTWAENVAAVPLNDWINATSKKGSQRIGAGLDEAKDKMETKFARILEHQDKVLAEVERMPDLTPEDREQRALAMMRGMRKFRG